MRRSEVIEKLTTEKSLLEEDMNGFKVEQKEMRREIKELDMVRKELEEIGRSRGKEGGNSDERYRNMEEENRKMVEKVQELTYLLDQERVALFKYKSEAQGNIESSRLSGDSKGRTLKTEEGLVSTEEYSKVLNDLKSSQEVILNLKGIISEYQQLIDEQQESKEEDLDRSAGSQKMY